MAARTDAAARSSVFVVFFFVFFLVFSYAHSLPNFTYNSQELRDIIQFKPKFFYGSSEDFHRTHNIPDEIARTPGPCWSVVSPERRRRRRKERKQKRGCRSGLLARLRRNPHRPALPSMFVTNARSITNKMDEMHLLMRGNRYVRDCCVSVITETWLNPRIPDEAVQLAGRSLHRWDRNKDSELIRSGSPTIYRLKPELENIGTLKRLTFGKRNLEKANKTILLVGETGTGKSTLINALVNYAIGVKWEDDVWFDIVGDEAANQSESQTSDVIVYEIFGFEGRTLPFSLTIIDAPGYGDTRGMNRDSIITQRLHDWFRFKDGIHEISAVGLVLKATENQLSDRFLCVFDSVTSLFGKDIEKNIVAMVTHSHGRKPKNVLTALEAAKIKCARDKQNQIVHFLFNNCQTEDREEDVDALEFAEKTSMKGLTKFTDFLSKIEPQKLKETVDVLNERERLEACIKNLKERITFIELKQKEVEESKKALAEFEKQMKENANFTVEVEEVYKEKQKINRGYWGLFFYEGAVCCTVCEENCHYPGCTIAWSPKSCEVMKRGRCTSCTGKCPVSDHVKEDWIYVSKTSKVQMTLEDMKKKYEDNKAGSETQLSLLKTLEQVVKDLELERNMTLMDAFHHVEMLEKIALNVKSLSTLAHLDFLITRLKESEMFEKAEKLEEMKSQVDEGTKAALCYKQLARRQEC